MDEGQEAEFRCKVDANPFDINTVVWDLPDRPGGANAWTHRSSLEIVLSTQTSVLTIRKVKRGDAGRVICRATNGLKGVVQVKTTKLIVNRKKIILNSLFKNK